MKLEVVSSSDAVIRVERIGTTILQVRVESGIEAYKMLEKEILDESNTSEADLEINKDTTTTRRKLRNKQVLLR